MASTISSSTKQSHRYNDSHHEGKRVRKRSTGANHRVVTADSSVSNSIKFERNNSMTPFGHVSADDDEVDDIEALVSLLEKDDMQLGPAIKVVFERSLQDTYANALNKHIRRKNTDIKQICNDNYEEFINSIDNLVTVKSEISRLHSIIVDLNEAVQNSGSDILNQADELIELQGVHNNIARATHLITRCQFVVDLFKKACEQTDKRKYFSAIKTLDQLKRNHLSKLLSFEFAKQFESQIPCLLLRIRNSVKAEFDSWLQDMQERSSQIGAAAISLVTKNMRDEERKQKADQSRVLGSRSNDYRSECDFNVEIDINDDIELHELSGVIIEEDIIASNIIELAPVHQALHIYENLSIGKKFVQYYSERRQAALTVSLEISELTNQNFLKVFSSYFANLAGFFIIEDSVLKCGDDFISHADVAAMWEMAINQIKLALIDRLTYIQEAKYLQDLKNQVVWFCRSVQSCSLNTTPLLDLMLSHRSKYEELLINRLRIEIEAIFEQEKYESWTVVNESEYDKHVVSYCLHNLVESSLLTSPVHSNHSSKMDVIDSTDSPLTDTQTVTTTSKENTSSDIITFPLDVPFSKTVPLICNAVKNFINDIFSFTRGLPHSPELLRNALDDALIRVVSLRLRSVLDANGSSLNVSQAVQVSINANAFAHVCGAFFERYIAVLMEQLQTSVSTTISINCAPEIKAYTGNRGAMKSVTLIAKSKFEETRVRAEDMVFEIVDAKIDQIMYGLGGNTNWCPTLCQDAPSDYIAMLVIYLETALTCVEHMPAAVRLAVHFTSCKHIVKILISFFLDAPRFNMIGIFNLDVDLQHLESYARRCHTKNVVESFAELRQLIDLWMSGNLQQFLHIEIREMRFALVSIPNVLVLLEHFRELSVQLDNTMPREIPRIRNKMVDNVAKQLRQERQH